MTTYTDFQDLKVLVVDDDRFMLTLVRSILLSLGFRTITDATSAVEGFSAMERMRPDLIITDWQMEPVDGLEFVRMVRRSKDSPNHYIPIIMLSGHTDMRNVIEARDAGVNEIAAKPVSIQALEKRIVSIVENPRPFIRTDTYFGPDRRRRDVGPPEGIAERRKRNGNFADPREDAERREIDDLLRKS